MTTVTDEIQKEYEERNRRFEELRKNKPLPGQVIKSLNGKPIPVVVERGTSFHGSPRRKMFVNAVIDPECTGWFLSSDSQGLKVLFAPYAQDELLDENDGDIESLTVGAVRVVRHSKTGMAVICELVDE